MAMTGLLRVGEVCIRVTDLGEARTHYVDRIGLIESHRGADDHLYLKCPDEHDAYSLVVRQADHPGIDYFAFKVRTDQDLDDFAEKLAADGIAVREFRTGAFPRSGRRIEFDLPSGHRMQLYAEKDQIGNGLPIRNPGVVPDEGYIRGMRTIRLDHLFVAGPELVATRRIFTDIFGFGIAEELISHEDGTTLVTFLSCSIKTHDIAFGLNLVPGQLHHISFLLESVNDLFHATDLIGKHNIAVDVASNRHGITRGATTYFFDPSGNRNEVFSGGYLYYPDSPTLIWDTTELGRATFSHDNMPRESFLTVHT
jgi:catechol 2,3-dioxygenase